MPKDVQMFISIFKKKHLLFFVLAFTLVSGRDDGGDAYVKPFPIY